MYVLAIYIFQELYAILWNHWNLAAQVLIKSQLQTMVRISLMGVSCDGWNWFLLSAVILIVVSDMTK